MIKRMLIALGMLLLTAVLVTRVEFYQLHLTVGF